MLGFEIDYSPGLLPKGKIANSIMNKGQKYTKQDLDEYIRQGEPQQRERGEAWKVAIGLQQVDGLQTSDYLFDTARKHIEGDITIEEAKELMTGADLSMGDGRSM